MNISSLKDRLSVIQKQKTVLPCVNFTRGERRSNADLSLQAHGNHGAESNPGTQDGVQNKDIGAVLQTDLTRIWFCL